MKKLIMCEGPNELAIVKILLKNDMLIFDEDELLHAPINLSKYSIIS